MDLAKNNGKKNATPSYQNQHENLLRRPAILA